MSIDQYDYGEYEEEPLLFSKLQLNIEEKYNLIYAFSQWYGDTAQDSEEFAFEFLVVTRGIMAGDVVMNPRYLLLDDCLEELVELLPEDQRQIYEDEYKLHISR